MYGQGNPGAPLGEGEPEAQAKATPSQLVGQLICGAIVGCWLPICCFLAKDNIDDFNCENADGMELWLTLNGTVTYGLPLFITLLLLIGVSMDISCIAAAGGGLQLLSGLFGIVMTIWGWVIVSGCSDKCTLDKSKVRPYMLMQVILIMQLVMFCLMCCCMSTAIVALVATAASQDRQAQSAE
jgi:hypothetical protein